MRRLLLRAWWHCGSADSREFVRGRLFFLLAQFVGLVRWRARVMSGFFLKAAMLHFAKRTALTAEQCIAVHLL